MDAVAVEHIEHVFPPAKRRGEPRAALNDLSFTVGAGEIFGLLGPNGGGKTTLFRILSTLLRPTKGAARVFGLDVASRRDEVRRQIGVVFQNPSLDKKLSLRENIVCQGRLYGLGGELRSRVAEVLERLKLSDRADDRVETLSGGLQRRGEIAKGLLHRPRLLLLDEPSTGLDPGARLDMWDYLAALKREGVTVLITTHLMDEAENCDRLAILSRGRCVSLGTPAELKEKIGGDVIRLESRKPDELARAVKEKFSCEASVVDGVVHIERRQGAAFIPELAGAFSALIESVHVGKPTLEDVFVHATGHRFWWDERPEELPR